MMGGSCDSIIRGTRGSADNDGGSGGGDDSIARIYSF